MNLHRVKAIVAARKSMALIEASELDLAKADVCNNAGLFDEFETHLAAAKEKCLQARRFIGEADALFDQR